MSEDHKDLVLEKLKEGASECRKAQNTLGMTPESNGGDGPGARQHRDAEAKVIRASKNMQHVILDADEMSCISKKEMRCYTKFSDDELDQFRTYDEDDEQD